MEETTIADSTELHTNSFNKDSIDIVVYHHPCIDGFGAAFTIWYYFKTKFGLERANQIKFKPASHSETYDNPQDNFYTKFTDKTVIIVDFSYKFNILQKIIEVANNALILDHHVSAEEDLKSIDNQYKIFDMKKSGAVLTWEYFFPNTKIPTFIQYIQDRDLWTNLLPKLDEFITFFNEIKFDFDLWETYLDDSVFNSTIEKGSNWLDYKNILVAKSAKRASKVIQIIDGQYCIVAYLNSSDFRSDIGSKIFNFHPLADFSCVWSYSLHKDSTNFSLRSTDDRFCVKDIAVKSGGGGHRNAAGVTIKGILGSLPYPIAHQKYIDLIESIKVCEFVKDEFKTSYVIIDCKELGQKFWRHPENLCLDLIKRKNKNVEMIVFQKDKKVNGKDTVYSYHIFYNELFNGNDTNKLLFDIKTLTLKIDSAKIDDDLKMTDNEYFNNTIYSIRK